MRATEFLTELFNSKVKVKSKYFDQDMTEASFKVSNGLTYTVRIGELFTIDDEPSDAVFNLVDIDSGDYDLLSDSGAFIMFEQDGQSGITGTGNAAEVMSGVLQIVGSYIKKFNPQMIAYHAREPSRQKLYSSIATRFGFKPVNNDGQYFLWKR